MADNSPIDESLVGVAVVGGDMMGAAGDDTPTGADEGFPQDRRGPAFGEYDEYAGYDDSDGEPDEGPSWQESVSGTMREAGGTIAAGFTALRDVRRAAKDAEDALREVGRLQEALEADRDELARRTDIEHNWAQIVISQTEELEAAQDASADAQARAELASSRREELQAQLTQMSTEHEDRLSPYRNLMESTKSRSDDASRALADARRNAKAAEQQKSSGEKQRDQRIAQARRAYESAQDRLRRTEAELTRAQGSPDASPSAISRLQNELVTERAHVDAARNEIDSVTAEETANVEGLQQRLWQQKQALDAAEKQASAAKEEANARKDEYDHLYKQATAEEDALKEQIESCGADIAQAQADGKAAEARAAEAQATIDEANDIHNNPQATADLQRRIATTQGELNTRTAEADELSGRVRELRSSTRGQRIAFIAALAAAIAVLILVLWLVLGR